MVEKKGLVGLGERIRFLRRGESIPSFAKKLGVHKNTLARYEREESYPDVGFIEKLCEVSEEDVTPGWVIEGGGSPPSSAYYIDHTEIRKGLSGYSTLEKAKELVMGAGLIMSPENLVNYIAGIDLPADNDLLDLYVKALQFKKDGSVLIDTYKGNGGPKYKLKRVLLKNIIETVEAMAEKHQTMAPDKKAEIITLLYEEISEDLSKEKLLKEKAKRLISLVF